MALTQEQMTNLLTRRIALRVLELMDFALEHPEALPELESEYEFLKKRLEELA